MTPSRDPRYKYRRNLTSSLVLGVLLLTGCGQTGPLYHPEQESPSAKSAPQSKTGSEAASAKKAEASTTGKTVGTTMAKKSPQPPSDH